MYAVVRSGGKQYSVREGQLLDVESVTGSQGDRIELTEVLLVSNDDGIVLGAPTVPGARVIAEVLEQRRRPKVKIFKYKPKTRYRRLLGHRQPFTRLAVREIIAG